MDAEVTDATVSEMGEATPVPKRHFAYDDRPIPTNPADLIAKHMNGKQKEWTAIADRERPLELLDLPVDVLQAVLREVPHTNDLTALALTHSALHNLVTPLIYSRFDIVWPEANINTETRNGVDALTYGLATLVMASDVFGEAQYQQRPVGHRKSLASATPYNIRRGNHFAQFTKKFSLGNGPADWVQEYLITKEGGKMLGTLVALAVGRMRNLEAFIWDMPTGVLRDVWLALASLGNRNDGQDCRLEKVWVRWHDNQDTSPPLSPPATGNGQTLAPLNIPSILAGSAQALFQIPPYPRVEFPTFSILPPLKSLSVLDIDELPYAEEMSVLIERSLPKMRELRVGMAPHASSDDWARPSEDRSLVPPLLSGVSGPASRPGGLFGILVNRFCQLSAASTEPVNPEDEADPQQDAISVAMKPQSPTLEDGSLSSLLAAQSLEDPEDPPPLTVVKRGQNRVSFADGPTSSDPFVEKIIQHRRLQLDILELERVHISVNALSRSIDWSRLTTLTLLGCRGHDQLWKELRRKFTPPSRLRTPSSASRSVSANLSGLFSSSRTSTPSLPIPSSDFYLKIRRIHTDAVSPALIAFIKDALAPDSLEWLFLQDNFGYRSTVTIDTISKAIRRHRGSLRKLLIDSETVKAGEPIPGSWKRWLVNRELLTYITSGKMHLRELSLSIDYKDWHYFIRHLDEAPTIRSLHIAHIAEYPYAQINAKDVADQIVNMVSSSPGIELCYLGVQHQCYEVLDYMATRKKVTSIDASPLQAGIDSEDEVVEEHEEELSDFEVASSTGEQTEDEGQEARPERHFKLREILFYDDKVSIFRARHGRL